MRTIVLASFVFATSCTGTEPKATAPAEPAASAPVAVATAEPATKSCTLAVFGMT
jgi:hypothetical protein